MAQNNLGQNQVFPIYDEDGDSFHNLSLKKSTLELTGMNLGDKITGDVLYNGTLTFTMREYIEYNGVKYILVNPPTQTRNGLVKDASSDAGMTKYTFVFYHPMALLSSFAFNDVAVSDDEEQYLSESHTFSWIGKIPDYCRKLNKNLEGTEWVCYVGSSVDEAMRNKLSEVLTFDNATIADALKTFYDTWEVPYIVDSITGTGQYTDPVTYEDYYTMGKRFVIILGYPSNEILNTTNTSYECHVSFLSGGLYRNANTIFIRKGSVVSADEDHYIYSSTFRLIGQSFTAEDDVRIYVAAPRAESATLTLTAPYIFQFGQGLGLKNNSRTPKNNKIVTRIVGYGSEENIPYGYPQIRWYGESGAKYTYGDHAGTYEDVTIGGVHFDKVVSYPIYKGIVGGQYVELIKHPFTRNHLMPLIYRDTLFNKISPYTDEGAINTDYDPDTTLIDYLDADATFPNPIDLTAPSVEIHQFEDVKPEFGEHNIVDAYAYWKDEEKRPWYTVDEYKAYIKNLKNNLASALKAYKLGTYIDMMDDYLFIAEDSDAGKTAYEGDKNDPIFYIYFKPNPTSTPYLWHMDATIKYRLFETETTGGSEITTWHIHEITLSLDVLRSDATGEPPAPWDDTMDDEGNYIQSYFKMTLPALGFDLYACASITQEMKINMRSGACIGCTFNVMVDWEDYKLNFYDSEGNFAPTGEQRNYDKYPDTTAAAVTFIVQKDNETFGTLMPNTYQQPKVNDQFVILGISLPETYITDAEQTLEEDMGEYMRENNVHYYEYPLQVDQHFLSTHTDILTQIKQNSIVRFMFGGVTNALYVKQMSIRFGEDVLPKYDITLADDIEIVLNQIGQATEDVSRMRVQMNEMQKYYGETQAAEIQNKLSRIADDVALGHITFQQGLDALGRAVFDREVRTRNFNHGMGTTGMGWQIDENGNAEFESVRVRSAFEAAELLINRLQAQEGDTAFSDNDKVQLVQTYTNEDDVNDHIYALSLEEKWDGYVTNMQYGYILRGDINTLAAKQVGVSDETSEAFDGNNGFYTSWMMVKGSYSDTDNYPLFARNRTYAFGACVKHGSPQRTYVFIRSHSGEWNDDDVIQVEPNTIWVGLYSDTDTPANVNYVPCSNMVISRWGYVLDPDEEGISDAERLDRERKSRSFYISTRDGRITKLRGVIHPKLKPTNFGTTLGTLPEFLLDQTTHASLVERIRNGKDYLYAQGIVVQDFIKIGANDEPEVNYVDKGVWNATTEYVNDITEVHDVWYNGEGWRCLQTNTGVEPTPTSPYWLRLIQKGASATQYEEIQYAWSAMERTNATTTPPSDVQTWSNNVPQNTQGLAYLWRKSTKYTLQADGSYIASLPVYVRLSGTNGTSITPHGVVKLFVDDSSELSGGTNGDKAIVRHRPYLYEYVNGAWQEGSTQGSDGDSYTVSDGAYAGQLVMYSSESATLWVPLGQFKGEDGITYYSHIVWATNVVFSGGTITRIDGYLPTKTPDDTTHVWMGVYADTNALDPTSGDDPILKQYVWSYIKGEKGTSVLAQYSADKTSWHSAFAEGDKYMRTSEDSGQTWGEAIQIVGEEGAKGDNGDYTDYTFGVNNDKNSPTGISSWADAPVPTTSEKPYLWSKVVQVTWNDDTPIYGEAKYVRLTGEKGTNGYNTATIVLYQRSANQPQKPSVNLTYTFATDTLTGNIGNWARTMPATDGNPCYTTQVSLSSQDATVTISPNLWSPVNKLVQDGTNGKMGRNFYYGGVWDTSRTTDYFKATDYEAPYFTVKKNVGTQQEVEEKWVYVGDNFGEDEEFGWNIQTISQRKCDGGVPYDNGNWEIMVTDFKYLISEAMFSDWARFGEWVFNKDYMFSNDGKDANGDSTSFDDGGIFYGFDDQRNTYTPNTVLDSQTGKVLFGAGKAVFNTDGSGWLANRNIQWDSDGNSTFNGTINATGGVFSGSLKVNFITAEQGWIDSGYDNIIIFPGFAGSYNVYVLPVGDQYIGRKICLLDITIPWATRSWEPPYLQIEGGRYFGNVYKQTVQSLQDATEYIAKELAWGGGILTFIYAGYGDTGTWYLESQHSAYFQAWHLLHH